jgi:hypothetical protein
MITTLILMGMGIGIVIGAQDQDATDRQPIGSDL